MSSAPRKALALLAFSTAKFFSVRIFLREDSERESAGDPPSGVGIA
jgi:hypothetical protein